MVQIPSRAALWTGGSFSTLLMRPAAVSSRSSPRIRDISGLTNVLKPVRRLSRNSINPILKVYLLKSHAKNMTAAPEGK
jgi:hypothetical protein